MLYDLFMNLLRYEINLLHQCPTDRFKYKEEFNFNLFMRCKEESKTKKIYIFLNFDLKIINIKI